MEDLPDGADYLLQAAVLMTFSAHGAVAAISAAGGLALFFTLSQIENDHSNDDSQNKCDQNGSKLFSKPY